MSVRRFVGGRQPRAASLWSTGGGTGHRAEPRHSSLARTGAAVVICGRREAPLAAVRAELEAAGAPCLVRPADVRERDQAEALVEDGDRRLRPRIDVLVNNAGGQFAAPAEEIEPRRLAGRAPPVGRGRLGAHPAWLRRGR